MDEKANAQEPAQSTAATNQPPAPPPIDPPSVAQGASSEGDKPRERMRTSDLIMSIATIVIALGTIVSAAAIVLQWREMVNGGADTTAIKNAAQKQADAAQGFAATAGIINGNINDAVKKLDAQAKATQSSANAATSAANTATRQLELTERPWVFIKDARVVSPLVFDKSGGRVTLEIILRNAGLSPAGNVAVVPRLYMLSNQEGSVAPIERLCNAASYHGDLRGGIMLFPNTDSPPQLFTVELSEEDIEKAQKAPPYIQDKLPLAITPFICVLYRPTFKDIGYSSAIQYDWWPAIWPEKTPTIPASSLFLHSSGFWGESVH